MKNFGAVEVLIMPVEQNTLVVGQVCVSTEQSVNRRWYLHKKKNWGGSDSISFRLDF